MLLSKKQMIALLVLLLALTGCNLERDDAESTPVPSTLAAVSPEPVITETPTGQAIQPTEPNQTAAPQATITAIAMPSNVLPPSPDPAEVGVLQVESNFDTPDSDWIAASDDIISRGYENGIYYLGITSPGGTRWGYTLGPGGTELRDIVVEYDVRLGQDTGDAAFGVICRRTDGENYYYLLVNNAGQIQIGRMVDNSRAPLSEWISAPNLRAASEFNRIRAGCVGNVLWIEGNGTLLARVEDTAYSSGSFGLYVVNNRAGIARAEYDNLLAVGR